jgi:hypothetical protein
MKKKTKKLLLIWGIILAVILLMYALISFPKSESYYSLKVKMYEDEFAYIVNNLNEKVDLEYIDKFKADEKMYEALLCIRKNTNIIKIEIHGMTVHETVIVFVTKNYAPPNECGILYSKEEIKNCDGILSGHSYHYSLSLLKENWYYYKYEYVKPG